MTGQLPTQAQLALQEGDLIGAIKHTREMTGMDLRDTKIAVEQFLAAHPELKERYREAARKGGRRAVRALVNIGWALLIGGFVVWLLTRR